MERQEMRPQNVCPACDARSEWWEPSKGRAKCPKCGHVCGWMQRKRLTKAERVEAAERRRRKARERRAADRDRINARQREWRARNRERVNLMQRLAYRRESPEQTARRRERSRAWYLANVEKANDSNRRYAAAHGAENAMRCKRYRLRKEQERRMEALR